MEDRTSFLTFYQLLIDFLENKLVPLSPMSEAPPVAPPVFTAVSVTSMVTDARGVWDCVMPYIKLIYLTCAHTHTHISCARKQLWYWPIVLNRNYPKLNNTLLFSQWNEEKCYYNACNELFKLHDTCLVYIILLHKLSPSIGSSCPCC